MSLLQISVAQTPEPRIRERIVEGTRVRLPGSHTPLAEVGEDLGAVPANKQLTSLTLVFKRSAAQQADLDNLLAEQQDPHSARYHQWLTPAAFAARFGMAAEDLAAVQGWLSAQGFTVESTPASRDRIVFRGSAAQVGAAFGTTLRRYQLSGKQHFGPATDLSLPAALGPVAGTLLHLSDLRPTPQSHPLPAFTDATTGAHFLTPADLGILYDFRSSTTDSLLGAGQSIAVVGQSYIDPMMFGLSTLSMPLGYGVQPSMVLVPGSGVEAKEPGAQAEAELDLEYAAGTAPLANLLYVFVGDDPSMNVFDALTFAVQNNVAPVVSISYGLCETLMSNSDASSGNALFQQAAAQGQTLVAASGDSGSTDCAPFTSGSLTTAQQQALSVSFPASSPYVVAIGGTQMAPNTFTPGANQFWSGTSTPQNTSVLSYVPEAAWNEGSPTMGILAAGGGQSAFFSRPGWQSGFPSMPPGANRLLPDLALQSSVMSPGMLLCTDDPLYVGPRGGDSCANGQLNYLGRYAVGGGTSFAVPVFAGAVALLNEYEQEQGQGDLHPTLYQLASNSSTYSSAFHDVTAGSIACVTGATGCSAAGQTGYSASTGYDEATGLGSVDFAQLRTAWPVNTLKDTKKQPIFFNCSTGAPNATPSTPDQFYCQLGPPTSTGTPASGTISVLLDGQPLPSGSSVAVDPNFAFTNFTLKFTAPSTAGSHLFQLSYPGDASHTAANATVPFMVGSVQATGAFSMTASNVTLAANGSGSSSIAITPTAGNAYHGVLDWNLSATQISGSASPQLCFSISPVLVKGGATAKLVLGAGTACSGPLPSGNAVTRVLATRSAAALHPPNSRRAVPICACLFGFGLLGMGRYRRTLPRVASVVCLALLFSLPLLGGCGGGANSSAATTGSTSSGSSSGSGSPAPSSQPAVYTLSLYGYDSVNTSLSNNTSMTLTVN